MNTAILKKEIDALCGRADRFFTVPAVECANTEGCFTKESYMRELQNVRKKLAKELWPNEEAYVVPFGHFRKTPGGKVVLVDSGYTGEGLARM